MPAEPAQPAEPDEPVEPVEPESLPISGSATISHAESAPEPSRGRFRTDRLDRPGQHVLIERFSLRVIDGPDTGATFVASSASMVVGSARGAHVKLRDPSVSRFHCEITITDGKALLRDLGSRNGTFVDGVCVLHAVVRSGSTLAVGRSTLRIELGGEYVPIALSSRERFGLLVGRSLPMRQVFATLEHAAASEATVLIEGETGTGKEVAAESIHAESARCEGPFVVVDCAAIPGELLESELFGHERGAFTGATSARDGAFAAADGGTIFLDEIGDLAASLQPKLLRVLEKREVKRIGCNEYRRVSVRVIAATNRSLRTEVNAQRFRSDLYYRLSVLDVRLPALREHLDDLPVLVDQVLESLNAAELPGAALVRSPDFLAELARHSWPGNVRELRNYVERALATHVRPRLPIDPEHGGPPALDTSLPLRVARDCWVEHFERRYLTELLSRHDDNVTVAARAAGVDRIHLHRLLRRHRLRVRSR